MADLDSELIELDIDPGCWVALTFAGAVFMLTMAGFVVTPLYP